MTLPFYEAVETRRTVRDFLPDPVPQEVLDRCLDAALKAHGACLRIRRGAR
ncbi:MAG: nitroreductase family protein [Acidobacteria bacterium]|nr:nitroreductase family protein [Acidobacteriota bacterium]